MRGNQNVSLDSQHSHGSIPACAGEPICRGLDRLGAEVYPRVCGGTQKRRHCAAVCGSGLSPRVRGNRAYEAAQRYCGRSIPACAGEPFIAVVGYRRRQVYPRVCGGTVDVDAETEDTKGLSPRVRGNLNECRRQRGACGSIPACAGEPFVKSGEANSTPVYPRVCGGTSAKQFRLWVEEGLSPRVRGNLIDGS